MNPETVVKLGVGKIFLFECLMQSLEPLILLVDGNNLAHFLYSNLSPGQKMTRADSQRLIEHMGSYSRSYPAHLHVELCLDRSPGSVPLPNEALRVCFAEYPQTADDLLLGRFWYHHLGFRRCLVITNDEAILEEVAEAGGVALRVSDFVRRPGLAAPVFRAPEELPVVPVLSPEDVQPGQALSLSRSIYFRITKEEESPGKQERSLPARAKEHSTQQTSVERCPPNEEPIEEASNPEAREPGQAGETASIAAQEEGPFYFLSIDTWPIEDGLRFLLSAFCARHRSAYQDLIKTFDNTDTYPVGLRPADMRALAELLVHACSDEPGFARRGALMVRVRLALLQARGEPLGISELAERTGLKQNGLRGRIKEKAAKWVEIYE